MLFLTPTPARAGDPTFARQTLVDHFAVANLTAFGLEETDRVAGVVAGGVGEHTGERRPSRLRPQRVGELVLATGPAVLPDDRVHGVEEGAAGAGGGDRRGFGRRHGGARLFGRLHPDEHGGICLGSPVV